MFCPKCGNQAPDDANFCMSCGADLSQYQQQASEGGVNTGDVGMIKDSEMRSAESQQQASIEQNPTINLHLGEIIRESVSEAMKQGSPEQQRQYERMQQTSVEVTADIAELLKKAKYATSDEEAEKYYDEILDVDLDNDIAWYQKFLLNTELPWSETDLPWGEYSDTLVRELSDGRSQPPHERIKQWLQDRIGKLQEGASQLEQTSNGEEDATLIQEGLDESRRLARLAEKRKLHKKAITYFQNALKAAPDKFASCATCAGTGIASKPCECSLKDMTAECIYCDGTGVCSNCNGTGRCPDCLGTGILKPGLYPEGERCKNFKCIGGRCGYCSPFDGKCSSCRGAGECAICNGGGSTFSICGRCFGLGQIRVSELSTHE